jgi:GNAT superfamily N-acetyltransferase
MHELTPDQFGPDCLRTVFTPMRYHLAVNSILIGATPARVFVDDPVKPRAALAWAGHRFHLAGVADLPTFNADLGRFFREVVYPQALTAHDSMFMLYYAPGAWQAVIEAELREEYPLSGARQYYAYHAGMPLPDEHLALPAGYELRAVDAILLAQTSLQGLDDVREEMCSERPSVEDFLARSFGVCVIHGNELAGWCLSEYNSLDAGAGRCEVGIETRPAYRQHGLATLMTRALLQEALARGIGEVGWHCWTRNVASARTALKAGLVKEQDYPCYFAWFNPVENLCVHGNLCLEQGDYAAAHEWYTRAQSKSGLPAWGHWNAARAAAALGQPDAALQHLTQARAQGFGSREQLLTTAEFNSLHAYPAWQTLIT